MTVAVAGNPNSGKTTIFNGLTGLRQKVANYAGVTVEKKTGRCRLPDGSWANIIDLPGTYSLISRSPDERVSMEVLRGLRKDSPVPDAVIVVVDASNLQRNLYLLSQLIEMGRPMVVALNMMDVAERRGLRVSPEALQRELGVPVIPMVGHKREGIPQLKQAIAQARVAQVPDWPLPEPMKQELAVVAAGLEMLDKEQGNGAVRPHNGLPLATLRSSSHYRTLAQRLLIGDHADDLNELASREPVMSLVTGASERLQRLGIDPMQADVEAHYRWIEQVTQRTTVPLAKRVATGNSAAAMSAEGRQGHLSERVDAVLISRVWGLLIFAVIMGAMFVAMFWLATPIQDVLKNGVTWLGTTVSSWLPAGPVKSLIRDGIFSGVGSVIVFIPQIAILFLFLAILEDSGYLARAAFLMDCLLAKVGLHGKSFIPLLSGFACAIPGIMATRTIENRKDRLVTILVLPFMTCSARLPLYALLVGTFFAGNGAMIQGSVMLSLYLLGIAAAACVAWLFKRTLLRGPTPAFIMELPTYKLPQLSVVGRQVWSNSSKFLTKAGTTIFFICMVLWAISYYPRLPQVQAGQYADPNSLAAAQRAYSIGGRLGHGIEPFIRPLGFDWKMGVGCIGAFAAREVFVSTMGIIYSTGEDVGEHGAADLSAAMRNDRYPDGRPVWTPLVAASLLLWFVLAMQCLSTVMVVQQETRGWKWPLFMLGYMNVMAYVACLTLYQVGSLVWGR